MSDEADAWLHRFRKVSGGGSYEEADLSDRLEPQPGYQAIGRLPLYLAFTEHHKLGVHLSHCNFGEYAGVCKYGSDDCPALSDSWSWFGTYMQRAEHAIKTGSYDDKESFWAVTYQKRELKKMTSANADRISTTVHTSTTYLHPLDYIVHLKKEQPDARFVLLFAIPVTQEQAKEWDNE